jgi:hypothetical protein
VENRLPGGCGFAHVLLLYGFTYAYRDRRGRVRIFFLLLILVETQASYKLIPRREVAINCFKGVT